MVVMRKQYGGQDDVKSLLSNYDELWTDASDNTLLKKLETSSDSYHAKVFLTKIFMVSLNIMIICSIINYYTIVNLTLGCI